MRNYLSILKKSAGFTLIELLVVIGILGILATTLIATIDPFEQIKKANDTKVQNVTVEFQTALVRYFTGQNTFPWSSGTCNTAVGSPIAPDYLFATPVLLSTLKTSCIQDLIDIGELKSGFDNVTGALENISLSQAVALTPIVCYKPTSKSGQADKAVIYDDAVGTLNTGTGGTACKSASGVSVGKDCYWCTK